MTTTITASNSEATTVGAAAELRHHGVREGPAAELRLGRLSLPPLGLLALSLVLRHLLSLLPPPRRRAHCAPQRRAPLPRKKKQTNNNNNNNHKSK